MSEARVRDGVRLVMGALQRELIRVGALDGEIRDNFRLQDCVPAPEPGQQRERQFLGRTAAVIDAAAVVEHTCEVLFGPLPALLARMKAQRTSTIATLMFSSENATAITSAIHNADVTRASRIGYGAEPDDAPPFDFDRTNACFDASEAVCGELDRAIAALEARMPRALDAEFYAPKGMGPSGHFVLLLSLRGMQADEISEILGRLPNPAAFKYQETLRRHRGAAVDNTKHLVQRVKAKSSRDGRSGTGCASDTAPFEVCTCVIVRKDVGTGESFTAYLGGRTDLPSTSGNRSPLDPHGPPAELAPGS